MSQSIALRAVLLGSLLSIGLGARASVASDGAIEINQVAALVGGITASDTPGFPVTLDTPGSYVLTGNLSVSGINNDGVLVTSADVTLDLGGYTIQGACPPGGCVIPGSGGGVRAFQLRTHVRNGRVRGFASLGVDLGARSRASGLIVEANGGQGLRASSHVDIVGVTAIQNGSNGIQAGSQSRVRDCIVDSSRFGGIGVGSDSIVSDNIVRNGGQGLPGIQTNSGSLVQSNVSSSNLGSGIHIEGYGGLVLDNTAVGNGGTGISAFDRASVQRNTSINNAGFGLVLAQVQSESAYRGNVINGNTAGSVSQGGVNLGGNSCNGTATCP